MGFQMTEVWTRKASDGKTITFKKEGIEKVGFVYYAQGRIATETWTTEENLSREQIEAHFADYLADPKPAKSVKLSEPELCGNPKSRHERGQHWDDVCHVEGCLCAHFVRA
jgi:hypothetical protein